MNKKTYIIASSSVMELDDKGIGVIYNNDDSDESVNDCNENNVNKPLLKK